MRGRHRYVGRRRPGPHGQPRRPRTRLLRFGSGRRLGLRHRPQSPQPGPPGKAPTLAPGPNGLTPVFERAKQHTDKTVALTFDADMTSDQGPRAAGGERFDNPQLISPCAPSRCPRPSS